MRSPEIQCQLNYTGLIYILYNILSEKIIQDSIYLVNKYVIIIISNSIFL